MAFIYSVWIFSIALFLGFEPLSAQNHHGHSHSHPSVSAGETLPETGTISELGTAEVTPDIGVVGNFGTWTVTYTAGSTGLQEGGGLKIQFPDPWHFGERNSAVHLQATKPDEDYFVTAQSPETDIRLETVVESE